MSYEEVLDRMAADFVDQTDAIWKAKGLTDGTVFDMVLALIGNGQNDFIDQWRQRVQALSPDEFGHWIEKVAQLTDERELKR